MPHEFKARIVHQVSDIMFGARVEVVDAQDVVTLPEQALAQVRTQESCPPGYQNPLVNAVAFMSSPFLARRNHLIAER